MKPRKPKPKKIKRKKVTFEAQNETWHEVNGHVLRRFHNGRGEIVYWIDGHSVTKELFMKKLKPLYPAPLDPVDGLG
jgi:hypothetical protein